MDQRRFDLMTKALGAALSRRGAARLLASGCLAALGWAGGGGERRTLRYDVARLPLGEGRFNLRAALLEPGSGRLLHALDEPFVFVVVAPGEERGVVLLGGRWSSGENIEVR